MSNVLIDRQKIDILANAISVKSGVPVTMTLDEMVEAVDGIETGGGGITPTGNINITQSGVIDVTNYVTATIPILTPEQLDVGFGYNYVTESGQRKWKIDPYCQNVSDSGGMMDAYARYSENSIVFNAVSSNISITPTESAQTIGGANYMMEGAVTVNAIPTTYVGSGIYRADADDVTFVTDEGEYVVVVNDGYYDDTAVKAVPTGTEGTPTTTKGTVSNHSVSVTPSVTNSAGYIEGGTKTGTAVTVSASELVSGTYNVTSSGTKDVTNYASASVPSLTLPNVAVSSATGTKRGSITTSLNTRYLNIPTGYNDTVQYYEIEPMNLGEKSITENGTYYSYMDDYEGYRSVTVNVSSGGGTSMQTDMVEGIAPSTSSVTFTGLKGEPTSFYINIDASVAVGTPSKVVAIVFDGTSLHGQIVTNTNNAQASYSTDFTKSYSNGTLTVTSTGGTFITSESYFVTYTYGGGIVDTADVQVGSGATSITFTGLEDEPVLWSCIFKSNFSTSSGYQRVMAVGELSNGNVVGYAMGSQANISTSYWTASYNNGSFTITSQGTNAGGYFHQPGYYQLTYAYDDGSSGNYQSKTVTPTTSQQVITADSGYDALSRVTVNAMPSGTTTAPTSISGTAASVSTGTNTLTLTKTVSVTPNVTTAGYISSGTAGNSSVSLTASVTTKAAATITPTTTNQTIAAGTYLTGTQTIAGDADLVGSNILSTANIFGVQGTVDFIDVYIRSTAPTSSVGNDGDIYIQE